MTAVEWLEEMIAKMEVYGGDLPPLMVHIKKAKEMENKQIIDFAVWFNNRDNTYKSYTQIVERYYNETFKNK